MLETVFLRNSLLLLCIMVLVGCHNTEKVQSLPYYNTADFTPIFLKEKQEVSKKITHTIPSFSFINQDSAVINSTYIEGKVHVVDFMFTSCGSICPRMTDEMKRVAEAFKNDTGVAILSYSVTPWIDTPQKLKAYKTNKGITNNNWQFLTGNKADIYTLARTGYFAEEDLGFTKDSTEFLHTEHFILVDKQKHIRGIYNGTLQLEVEQLIKDIKLLQAE